VAAPVPGYASIKQSAVRTLAPPHDSSFVIEQGSS